MNAYTRSERVSILGQRLGDAFVAMHLSPHERRMVVALAETVARARDKVLMSDAEQTMMDALTDAASYLAQEDRTEADVAFAAAMIDSCLTIMKGEFNV